MGIDGTEKVEKMAFRLARSVRYRSQVLLGLAVLSALAGRPAAAEGIVSKTDADRIFGFTRAEWTKYANQATHPDGWEVRLNPMDTGVGMMAYDQKSGYGLSVQPLFADDSSPPFLLIVSS